MAGWRQTVPRAELLAVIRALETTSGDGTYVVDASYVYKGAQHGPQHKYRSNADLWAQYWQAVHSRVGELRLVKVKSHQDRSAVGPGFPLEFWFANDQADKLAEKAAQEAGPPFSLVGQVQEADKLAWRVQKHLVAVALEVAKNAKDFYGTTLKGDVHARAVAKAKAKAQATPQLLRESEHKIFRNSKGWKCAVCLDQVGVRALEEFSTSLCPGRPFLIDISHRIENFRGLWFCRLCGAQGVEKFVRLAKKCDRRLSKDGVATLKAIDNGELPKGVKCWPDSQRALPRV
eukprot:4831494-Pyramimonas_sp.AAC.1